MSMNAILTATTSVATSVIAVCALTLTFRSWRDNHDKLRLDLFNRRFSIYQRVLVFYQQLIVWQDRDDQKALMQPFIEASREALFIFPKKSGVYEYIQEFWNHSWHIINHNEAAEPLRDCGMNEELAKLFNKRTEHVNWILGSITELEKLMNKSMSFERLWFFYSATVPGEAEQDGESLSILRGFLLRSMPLSYLLMSGYFAWIAVVTFPAKR